MNNIDIEKFRKTSLFKVLMFWKNIGIKFDFCVNFIDALIYKLFKFLSTIISWIILIPFVLFKWVAFDLFLFLFEKCILFFVGLKK